MSLLGGERGEYLGYVGSDRPFGADLGSSQTLVFFFKFQVCVLIVKSEVRSAVV